MITEFFLNLWFNLARWFLSLFGEYEGLPAGLEDAISGVASLWSQASGFLGALDRWFPVGPFLSLAGVAIAVEAGIAFVRGVRTLKQLLPFQ